MQIKNSTVLILGGWGLVGSVISRKILEYKPSNVVICSLKQSEAEEAVNELKSDPDFSFCEFHAEWGNIFTRTNWKDTPYYKLLDESDSRMELIKDTFGDLTDNIKNQSFLYEVLTKHKPNLVIDCINTATGIAYLDIYNSSLNVIKDLDDKNMDRENIEKLMSSTYIPQLIRHIQLMSEGLNDSGSETYIKVGTSGTGGMGLNIPYTHSEESPSRVLMSKTAVAGAQSLLMYLMARTPNKCLVKEIKPAATIAWKKIAYGKVMKGGRPVKIYDQEPSNAKTIAGSFDFADESNIQDTGNELESVFIDTGENGIFSKREFETISSLGQMEIVTPEEIADLVVHEARGGNTGKDVIQGLDAFALGPSYRGGYLRNYAMEELSRLEEKHGEAVAFELLGPPRLSKLLYEANLIKKIVGDFESVLAKSSTELRDELVKYVSTNQKVRSEILSIGLPILISENEFLRGKVVKIPVNKAGANLEMTNENVDKWCFEGWIDLREKNVAKWQQRLQTIRDNVSSIKGDTSGSRYYYTRQYWSDFAKIEEGKLAAWIFEKEDDGWRFKR